MNGSMNGDSAKQMTACGKCAEGNPLTVHRTLATKIVAITVVLPTRIVIFNVPSGQSNIRYR